MEDSEFQKLTEELMQAIAGVLTDPRIIAAILKAQRLGYDMHVAQLHAHIECLARQRRSQSRALVRSPQGFTDGDATHLKTLRIQDPRIDS